MVSEDYQKKESQKVEKPPLDHRDDHNSGEDDYPVDPCAKTEVQARMCVHHENTTREKAIRHEVGLGMIHIGKSGPVHHNVALDKVPPIQVQAHLEGKEISLAVGKVRLCWCEEEPLRVSMDTVEFAPLSIEKWPDCNINVGRFPACKISFEDKELPAASLNVKELPVLRHQLTQEFFIPSRYKISINLFGSEVGAIGISGGSVIVPRPLGANNAGDYDVTHGLAAGRIKVRPEDIKSENKKPK